MTSLHVPPTRDELATARQRLAAALDERDAALRRYEAAMGTSVEQAAYTRVRAATRHASACDRWLRWAESDRFYPPPR
jgi:hypothetical protein